MTATREAGQGSTRNPELEALQAALAAEHAAVYGYGVAGARLDGSAESRARAAFDAHRARRDQLSQLIRGRKGEPAAAAPAYALPFPVRTAAEAIRLAAHLEESVAAAYADLVAAGDRATRQLAARALQEAAVRAVGWRGTSVPFPGLSEVAPRPVGSGGPGSPSTVASPGVDQT